MRKVSVAASKSYEVHVGENLLAQIGQTVAAACGGERVLIVTDDMVGGLYGKTVENAMIESGYAASVFTFPRGEQSKSMDTYIALLSAMAAAGLTRSDIVAAVGGGVVGDLAGFAAATYMRGIRFAQIPTTLLAMVDSSVGGKTAIDLPSGKNQVGAFYQPDVVVCDISTLATLPEETFTDGCAEIIKHGIILSEELFNLLKRPIKPQLEDIVTMNITIKSDIVMADERDTGIRQILNFGHTIGHGIEAGSNYMMTHGRAVAIGMAISARGAYRMGICGEDCYMEIVDMIRRHGLPIETDIPPDRLIQAAFVDKKRNSAGISLILPEKIGKCAIKSFSMEDLAAFIHLGMQD
ncbi:MAG: 3-dehydroquinate synthase [Oscillospiraceae bacterium]|nr:3-dehydroquinate synthase [Oscillospiraceae bacterium]